MFRVEWVHSALDELTAIWIGSDSTLRQAITAATNHVDLLLQTDPLRESESRPGGRRILLVAPVGILFRVEPDDRTLTVLRVWVFPKRSGAG